MLAIEILLTLISMIVCNFPLKYNSNVLMIRSIKVRPNEIITKVRDNALLHGIRQMRKKKDC